VSSDLLRARLGLFPPEGTRLIIEDTVDEVPSFQEDTGGMLWRQVRLPHRKIVLTLYGPPAEIPLSRGGFLRTDEPEKVGLWIAGRIGAGDTRDGRTRDTLRTWRTAGWPITGVLTVCKAVLVPELRHQGFGVAAYLRLAEIAAQKGDAIQAHAADTGTSVTSADALHAWASLERLGVASGLVAWAGERG
jgi:hypothetical protein